MTNLTRIQQETLDALVRFWRERGRPPTIRELAEYLPVRSSNTVHRRVKQLIQVGAATMTPGKTSLKPVSLEIKEKE